MNADAVFMGSLPDVYDSYLGPLLFSPYVDDMDERAALARAVRVLELASETGIATMAVPKRLPDARIQATDLNSGMVWLAESRRRPSPGALVGCRRDGVAIRERQLRSRAGVSRNASRSRTRRKVSFQCGTV